MILTVHITRDDINKAEFLNKNSAESIALKRALLNENICVLDTSVSNHAAKSTMWSEIFYATKHHSIKADATIHCYKTSSTIKTPD